MFVILDWSGIQVFKGEKFVDSEDATEFLYDNVDSAEDYDVMSIKEANRFLNVPGVMDMLENREHSNTISI